jgi:hypothetical protein
MESVSTDQAGVASGVNNAISRIAGLLAVAVFGLVLSTRFNERLDRSLAQMSLSAAERQNIDAQRSRLAGARTEDPRVNLAVDEAFVSGYRSVISISIGLALLSAICGYWIIDADGKAGASRPEADDSVRG